jgi:hypothetical protein
VQNSGNVFLPTSIEELSSEDFADSIKLLYNFKVSKYCIGK